MLVNVQRMRILESVCNIPLTAFCYEQADLITQLDGTEYKECLFPLHAAIRGPHIDFRRVWAAFVHLYGGGLTQTDRAQPEPAFSLLNHRVSAHMPASYIGRRFFFVSDTQEVSYFSDKLRIAAMKFEYGYETHKELEGKFYVSEDDYVRSAKRFSILFNPLDSPTCAACNYNVDNACMAVYNGVMTMGLVTKLFAHRVMLGALALKVCPFYSGEISHVKYGNEATQFCERWWRDARELGAARSLTRIKTTQNANAGVGEEILCDGSEHEHAREVSEGHVDSSTTD